jgi:hypothetical protein
MLAAAAEQAKGSAPFAPRWLTARELAAKLAEDNAGSPVALWPDDKAAGVILTLLNASLDVAGRHSSAECKRLYRELLPLRDRIKRMYYREGFKPWQPVAGLAQRSQRADSPFFA